MELSETLKDSVKDGHGPALKADKLIRFVEKVKAGGGTQKALTETLLSVCNLGFARGLESNAGRPET